MNNLSDNAAWMDTVAEKQLKIIFISRQCHEDDHLSIKNPAHLKFSYLLLNYSMYFPV